MLSPTRSLLTVGASFLTTRTARKLRRAVDAVPAQKRTFTSLCTRLAETAYGRTHGITPDITYAQFQARVPLQTHEGFAPFIERMQQGETDVLWPGRCNFYAVSSGTNDAHPKYLPVTDDLLEHFRHAGRESLLYYTARVGHAGVFRGKQLLLGGCTTLSRLGESKAAAYAGPISGITALNLPGWVEKHLYEPGPEVARIADWSTRITAIAERTWHSDITLIAGMPTWVIMLAEAIKARASHGHPVPANLQSVWPNLECFVHGGVPIGPYADELRTLIGPKVNFHEVYPASEGFIATQDTESVFGLRLMTDAGLFFEFLPMQVHDEGKLAQLGQRTVTLEGVQVGVDYALVLTTPAGLTRYVIGDVVRFLSTDIPRLVYLGRTALQLNTFGERVIEKELTDALVAVCQRHGWTTVNFHAAPFVNDSTAGLRRGSHEWWVELKPYTAETPTGPVIALELDVELKRLNKVYEAKRKEGGLDAPLVKLVMPGVFEHWMRAKDKWGDPHKMPRCRSDRRIADELAQVARFSSEA